MKGYYRLPDGRYQPSTAVAPLLIQQQPLLQIQQCCGTKRPCPQPSPSAAAGCTSWNSPCLDLLGQYAKHCYFREINTCQIPIRICKKTRSAVWHQVQTRKPHGLQRP